MREYCKCIIILFSMYTVHSHRNTICWQPAYRKAIDVKWLLCVWAAWLYCTIRDVLPIFFPKTLDRLTEHGVELLLIVTNLKILCIELYGILYASMHAWGKPYKCSYIILDSFDTAPMHFP